jgi:hypothetical protein
MRSHDHGGGDRVRTRGNLHARRPSTLQRHSSAVEGDVQIVDARAGPARDAELCDTTLRDLQVVLGIERERVAHDDAAARAERKAFEVHVLREVAGNRVGDTIEADCRIANGESTDLRRRRRIPFDQRRRDTEHVGDVVESRRRVIGRQHRRDVDVQVEQVANDVGVLGAVQTMQRRDAGIVAFGSGAIERRFE